jgi:hypothetical protein
MTSRNLALRLRVIRIPQLMTDRHLDHNTRKTSFKLGLLETFCGKNPIRVYNNEVKKKSQLVCCQKFETDFNAEVM